VKEQGIFRAGTFGGIMNIANAVYKSCATLISKKILATYSRPKRKFLLQDVPMADTSSVIS